MARKVARQRHLMVIGTLGVLLRAKSENHLEEVAPVLRRMTDLGMFVAPSLEAEVLRLAQE